MDMKNPPSAIILSAGFGTRLRPLTWFTPKPLIKINRKLCIQYIIDNLNRAGIDEIYVNIHYKPLQFLRKLYSADGLMTVFERDLLGTAGSIKRLLPLQTENFVVVNGDTISTLDIKKMYDMHVKMGNIATLAWDKDRCTGTMIFNKEIDRYLPSHGMIDDVLKNTNLVSKYFSQENKYWDIGTWKGLRKAQKDVTVNLLSKLL